MAISLLKCLKVINVLVVDLPRTDYKTDYKTINLVWSLVILRVVPGFMVHQLVHMLVLSDHFSPGQKSWRGLVDPAVFSPVWQNWSRNRETESELDFDSTWELLHSSSARLKHFFKVELLVVRRSHELWAGPPWHQWKLPALLGSNLRFQRAQTRWNRSL